MLTSYILYISIPFLFCSGEKRTQTSSYTALYDDIISHGLLNLGKLKTCAENVNVNKNAPMPYLHIQLCNVSKKAYVANIQ